jgi:tellurite resistance protein TerC
VIPRKYQYRALLWGIFGVIVLRGIMIAAGAALVHEYAWILYIFGAFLILTGIKMLFVPESNPDLENNVLVCALCKYMRTTHRQHERSSDVQISGR